MSKAFTRESDEDERLPLPVRAALPSGVKNYITPAGAQRLRDELAVLLAEQTSRDDKQGSTLREARVHQLQEIIGSLVVAETPTEQDTVRFGATVTVKRGTEIETDRLVGVDETNLDRNEISWLSPLGKVLIGKRAGDKVRFRSPSGVEELSVLSASYG